VTEALAARVALRDGTPLVIRPIEPEDKPQLLELFEGLSEQSRRQRYLTPATELTAEDLAYLTEVDHGRHEALIGFDEDGRPIGLARYVRVPGEPELAELAAEVVDDWHGRGVATALIRKLSDRALANGIRRYRAYVASDNQVVLDALGRAGARHSGEDAGELEFVVEVPRDGLGVRLRGALTAAGRGQLRIARRMAARMGLISSG
jgi:RimJ/RimL family protein N-acetyltransferase